MRTRTRTMRTRGRRCSSAEGIEEHARSGEENMAK
jgi:hypothetical protein